MSDNRQSAYPFSSSDRPERWWFFGPTAFGPPSDALTALLARNWWLVALRGVFSILFGLAALFLPIVTLAALVLLFAAYMLVDGIFAIIAAIRAARHHRRWGTLVLEGIADLVAAAIAFFWPLATVLAFVLLSGAWAIVSGGLLLSAAFRLNIASGRWLMGIGGALSLIWGILILLQPGIGALVLTMWLGAYALIFGVMLLVLAVRLYRAYREMPSAQPQFS
jgi:uncharacterized membrane protein HdeD (DUF308 family)